MPGEIKEDVKTTTGAINDLTDALNQFSNESLKSGLTFRTIEASLNAVSKSADTFITQIAGLGAKADKLIAGGTKAQGLIGTGLGFLGDGIKSITSAMSFIPEAISTLMKAGDAVTAYERGLTASMFETASAFGLGLDAARQYGDYITSNARDFATADYGFISSAERIAALKAMGTAGIPLEKLSDTIKSTAGSFDLLNVAILQSEALGMDLSSYMQNMASLMNKQGMSSQQAAEQMAAYGDIAENTGFKVSTVASSLGNFADRFSKLGMSAAFGRPVLEGFTNSLRSMGLGFENAIDLAAGLNDSIASLSSNYAMAYLTFQRGGLDFGGGGTVLGASIGMRASLLDAEKRGTQGDMGLQIAGAIKETLASYTGGEIITVTQAAESPELQQAFYTQTKLLESMYGISDTAAQDRTLELLQQINEATAAGDKDLADSLGRDLGEAIDVRDKTLSTQEKIAKYVEGLFAELQYTHRDVVRALDGTMSKQVDLAQDIIGGVVEAADPSLRATGRRASDRAGYDKLREEVGKVTPTPPGTVQPTTEAGAGGTVPTTPPASPPGKLEEVVSGLANSATELLNYIRSDRSGRGLSQ
jgi:uncharacterized protein YdbL (DUF1318 family)